MVAMEEKSDVLVQTGDGSMFVQYARMCVYMYPC